MRIGFKNVGRELLRLPFPFKILDTFDSALDQMAKERPEFGFVRFALFAPSLVITVSVIADRVNF